MARLILGFRVVVVVLVDPRVMFVSIRSVEIHEKNH